MTTNMLKNIIHQEESAMLELRKCVSLYRRNSGCGLNAGINCDKCGAIPLLLKMCGEKVNHDNLHTVMEHSRIIQKIY